MFEISTEAHSIFDVNIHANIYTVRSEASVYKELQDNDLGLSPHWNFILHEISPYENNRLDENDWYPLYCAVLCSSVDIDDVYLIGISYQAHKENNVTLMGQQ